jgi:hypothetical protein
MLADGPAIISMRQTVWPDALIATGGMLSLITFPRFEKATLKVVGRFRDKR